MSKAFTLKVSLQLDAADPTEWIYEYEYAGDNSPDSIAQHIGRLVKATPIPAVKSMIPTDFTIKSTTPLSTNYRLTQLEAEVAELKRFNDDLLAHDDD